MLSVVVRSDTPDFGVSAVLVPERRALGHRLDEEKDHCGSDAERDQKDRQRRSCIDDEKPGGKERG